MTSITTDRKKSSSPGFMYICGGPGTGKVSVMGLVVSFGFHTRSMLSAHFSMAIIFRLQLYNHAKLR